MYASATQRIGRLRRSAAVFMTRCVPGISTLIFDRIEFNDVCPKTCKYLILFGNLVIFEMKIKLEMPIPSLSPPLAHSRTRNALQFRARRRSGRPMRWMFKAITRAKPSVPCAWTRSRPRRLRLLISVSTAGGPETAPARLSVPFQSGNPVRPRAANRFTRYCSQPGRGRY